MYGLVGVEILCLSGITWRYIKCIITMVTSPMLRFQLSSLKAEGAHTKWRFDIVNWKVERRKQKMSNDFVRPNKSSKGNLIAVVVKMKLNKQLIWNVSSWQLYEFSDFFPLLFSLKCDPLTDTSDYSDSPLDLRWGSGAPDAGPRWWRFGFGLQRFGQPRLFWCAQLFLYSVKDREAHRLQVLHLF